MQKILSLGLVIAMLASCSPAKKEEAPKKDISTMSEEEIQAYADELAHKFIIVDGHVDLPYRMEVKGFMLRKEVEDVSVETSGNFDFPKSKFI